MIIEIIVLLGFLISLAGFIFFIKHYLKTWKARSDNKRILLAIETADNESACTDRYYNNILKEIPWAKFMWFIFWAGILIIIFWQFAPSNNTSTGNQGVVVETPTPIPASEPQNNSITSLAGALNQTGVPFWVFVAIGGIFFWFIWRNITRHSFL